MLKKTKPTDIEVLLEFAHMALYSDLIWTQDTVQDPSHKMLFL